MNTLVVKVGGAALAALTPSSTTLAALAEDVRDLQRAGTTVVIVHGGGPAINDLLAAVGEPSLFHEGLRVTPPSTVRYVDMALADTNRQLVAALTQAGLASVGLSGVDGGLLTATSIGQPWDRVATTPVVDTTVLRALWASGFTPVVSPVALDEHGDRLNCNADTAAGALAGALGAQGLVLLSDIDQVRAQANDPTTGLATVSLTEIDDMIARGQATDGMRPKLNAAADAVLGGAARVWLANGTVPHALRDVLAGTRQSTEVTP